MISCLLRRITVRSFGVRGNHSVFIFLKGASFYFNQILQGTIRSISSVGVLQQNMSTKEEKDIEKLRLSVKEQVSMLSENMRS